MEASLDTQLAPKLNRRFVFNTLCVLGPLFIFVIGEILLNSQQQKIIRVAGGNASKKWLMAHSKIGWVSEPGIRIATLSNGIASKDFRIEIGSIGERITAPNSRFLGKADRILIGDSFTFGTGIEEHESFAGILARHSPSESVINLGVSGYSAYQSLLLLEELFQKVDKSKTVIYDLVDVSVMKSVATYEWQQLLAGGSQIAKIPHAISFYSGQLMEFSPHPLAEAYPACHFPGILCLWKRYLLRTEDIVKNLRARDTVKEVLIRMRNLSEAHGATFSVLLLGDGLSDFEKFLTDKGIKSVLVNYHQFDTLPFDQHPVATFHEAVSKAIIEKLWN